MPFQQPELPYKIGDLSPFMSEEQLDFHYNKHHATYFKKLNGLVSGKSEENLDLETLVKTSSGAIFNNAAQAWNHILFWSCMSPDGGGMPQSNLLSAIERSFGSYDAFIDEFTSSAINLFGSGWTWLATDSSGKLEVISLSNAGNPLTMDKTPILGLDVWEHSYYIDYRNNRPAFIEGFWDVINWQFVESKYKEAL